MLSDAEVLDARASKVGQKLMNIEVEIRELHRDINFGPDLTEETEDAFRSLSHVRDLIAVATDLYPYTIQG